MTTKLSTVLLWTLSIILVSLSACSEEEEEPTIQYDLVGEWIVSSIRIEECDNPTLNEANNNPCPTSNCQTWEFRADSTYVITRNGQVLNEGPFSTTGDELIMCFSNPNDPTDQFCEDNQFYTIEGSRLNLRFPDSGNCVNVWDFDRVLD